MGGLRAAGSGLKTLRDLSLGFAPGAVNDLISPQSIMNPNNANSNAATDGFTHAMRREIYQQPQAIAKTIEQHLKNDILFPGELNALESALLTFEPPGVRRASVPNGDDGNRSSG